MTDKLETGRTMFTFIRCVFATLIATMLGATVVASASTASVKPTYSVGVEYCNGGGQLDEYSTIRGGVSAYVQKVLAVTDYRVVSLSRRYSGDYYLIHHHYKTCK